MKKTLGYTLIELLITISIAVIVMSAVVPNLASATMKHKTDVIYLQIKQAFSFARDEAMRRGQIIYICAADFNSTGSLSGCDSSGDWSKGLLIYMDINQNATYSSSDLILKTLNYNASNLKPVIDISYNPNLTMTSAVNQVFFNPDGSLNSATVINVSQTLPLLTYSTKFKADTQGYVSICQVGATGC